MNDAAAAAVDAVERGPVVVAAPKPQTEAEKQRQKLENEVVTDKLTLMFVLQVRGCRAVAGCAGLC